MSYKRDIRYNLHHLCARVQRGELGRQSNRARSQGVSRVSDDTPPPPSLIQKVHYWCTEITVFSLQVEGLLQVLQDLQLDLEGSIRVGRRSLDFQGGQKCFFGNLATLTFSQASCRILFISHQMKGKIFI